MYQKEMYAAIEAGILAQKEILKVYKKDFKVEYKEDNSPVTEADKTSDLIIRGYLKSKFPDYYFLTEEGKDDKERLNKEFVWIIDPLDGTEDFVKKDDEFSINIALSKNHEIVMGVIIIPVTSTIYCAIKGEGAYKINYEKVKRIYVSKKNSDLTCFTSIYHLKENELAMIDKHKDKITNVIKKGSSLKACLIAEGLGEISYRLSKGTKERDTAAFDIIVREAGGLVLKPDGTPMIYNRENVYNDEGYVIVNRIENFLL